MLNLFYWGVFGEKLDEDWKHNHPEEYAKQEYENKRWEYQCQLKKHPKAKNTIRMLELEDYRKYVRRMLEIDGSGIIGQYEDL